MNRTAYLVGRLVQLPLVLLVISMLLFSLMHTSPGDPISIYLGENLTEELQQALEKHYGLDKPIYEQYILWMWKIAHGDLGRSIRSGENVLDMIFDRLPTTMTLAILAMVLALVIAIPVGLVSAYRQNTYLDHFLMVGVMIGQSSPDFVLAILLILIFAVKLGALPTSGMGDLLHDPLDAVRYFILPAMALAISRAPVFARLLRSSVIEVLASDYLRVARSKGLSNQMVLLRHVLKNAIIPLITVIGINFAFLFGGAITVEWIFALPGIGNLLVLAVGMRDYPIIQGITLFSAFVLVVTNLCVDIVYGIVDPRIRYG